MKRVRKIIHIDEAKCTGCGDCILDCAEGALELVDGKAKLVGEVLCDGLGACLNCPEEALSLVEREAEEFDEEAVNVRLSKIGRPALPHSETSPQSSPAGGCPSARGVVLPGGGGPQSKEARATASALGHFPVKLQLLGPGAPFLEGSDLVLLADCVATCYPDLHTRLLPGKTVAMGCPKLDDVQAHIRRLSEIIEHSRLNSLTVAHMEVPCCHGFVHVAQEAVKRSGIDLPLGRLMIGRDGCVLTEETARAFA